MRRTEFCEYVDQYRNQLYVTAYTILENQTDAEDAVCSAILKGYEHLEQLKNPRKFRPWMLTITKNEALKLKEKRLELLGNENVEKMLTPIHDSYNELWDMIQALKEEYRLVIVLFYYDELSVRDISDILDIPVGTVKSRLKRGRGLLKKGLEEVERGKMS